MQQAMILAAGMGVRMRPLSLGLPKPLFPVLNQPSIKRILHHLQGAGFKKAVINTFHLAKSLTDAINTWNIDIEIVTIVEPFLLGTGGALKNALPYFDENSPVLLINSDVVTDLDLGSILQRHCHGRAIATMLVHDRNVFNNVKVEDRRIAGFGYNGPDALAFTGISVLQTDFINSFPDLFPSSLIEIISMAIRSGEVVSALRAEYLKADYIWEDIGTAAGYLAAHETLLKGEKNNMLVGKRTDIPKDLCLNGWCSIGNDVFFGRDISISRAVVWDGCAVRDGERLEDCIVTPYGRLTLTKDMDQKGRL